MMNKALLLRQLKDIQFQADKLYNGNPNIAEIEDFKRYSEEIKMYLQEHIDLPEVRQLMLEIPTINTDSLDVRKNILLYALGLRAWTRERRIIAEAQQHIQVTQGKFASIAFILKAYLED